MPAASFAASSCIISGYLEPGLDVLVTGSTLGQIVNSVDEGRVETILEGKTELEAIWIPGLLNEHPEGVNIFVKRMLPLTILIPIPQGESRGLSWVKGKEFCPKISLKGCPVREAVYPAWTLEHSERVGQCAASLHV